MLAIPSTLQKKFEIYLKNKAIPDKYHGAYKKWLRNYLDFRLKYPFSPGHKESLPYFIQKLQEKRQTKAQQEQAIKSIALYYQIVTSRSLSHQAPKPENSKRSALMVDKPFPNHDAIPGPIQYEKVESRFSPDPAPSPRVRDLSHDMRQYEMSDSGPLKNKQEKGASWIGEYSILENEIRVRHYSSKTLKTYKGWVRKFQTFTLSRPPHLLSANDVKEYVTFLAVKRNVSSSTQNQAFNSLLFFYRHVLKKEFGKIDSVVRAKRKPYIPVVLSREEIETVLKHLEPPYDLVAKLLYGCGLRLFECLDLRVHCMYIRIQLKV